MMKAKHNEIDRRNNIIGKLQQVLQIKQVINVSDAELLLRVFEEHFSEDKSESSHGVLQYILEFCKITGGNFRSIEILGKCFSAVILRAVDKNEIADQSFKFGRSLSQICCDKNSIVLEYYEKCYITVSTNTTSQPGIHMKLNSRSETLAFYTLYISAITSYLNDSFSPISSLAFQTVFCVDAFLNILSDSNCVAEMPASTLLLSSQLLQRRQFYTIITATHMINAISGIIYWLFQVVEKLTPSCDDQMSVNTAQDIVEISNNMLSTITTHFQHVLRNLGLSDACDYIQKIFQILTRYLSPYHRCKNINNSRTINQTVLESNKAFTSTIPDTPLFNCGINLSGKIHLLHVIYGTSPLLDRDTSQSTSRHKTAVSHIQVVRHIVFVTCRVFSIFTSKEYDLEQCVSFIKYWQSFSFDILLNSYFMKDLSIQHEIMKCIHNISPYIMSDKSKRELYWWTSNYMPQNSSYEKSTFVCEDLVTIDLPTIIPGSSLMDRHYHIPISGHTTSSATNGGVAYEWDRYVSSQLPSNQHSQAQNNHMDVDNDDISIYPPKSGHVPLTTPVVLVTPSFAMKCHIENCNFSLEIQNRIIQGLCGISQWVNIKIDLNNLEIFSIHQKLTQEKNGSSSHASSYATSYSSHSYARTSNANTFASMSSSHRDRGGVTQSSTRPSNVHSREDEFRVIQDVSESILCYICTMTLLCICVDNSRCGDSNII